MQGTSGISAASQKERQNLLTCGKTAFGTAGLLVAHQKKRSTSLGSQVWLQEASRCSPAALRPKPALLPLGFETLLRNRRAPSPELSLNTSGLASKPRSMPRVWKRHVPVTQTVDLHNVLVQPWGTRYPSTAGAAKASQAGPTNPCGLFSC